MIDQIQEKPKPETRTSGVVYLAACEKLFSRVVQTIKQRSSQGERARKHCPETLREKLGFVSTEHMIRYFEDNVHELRAAGLAIEELPSGMILVTPSHAISIDPTEPIALRIFHEYLAANPDVAARFEDFKSKQ